MRSLPCRKEQVLFSLCPIFTENVLMNWTNSLTRLLKQYLCPLADWSQMGISLPVRMPGSANLNVP